MDTEFNESFNVPSIMVVDDKPDNLRSMCDILMEQYWMVRPVRSGAEIMQEVSSDPPDLIIMDVMTADVDGLEACSALKNNPVTRHIPVIMLTPLDDRESRIKGFQAGADDYFCKPVIDTEILVRVRNLLQVKQLWDQKRDRYKNLERQTLELTEMLRAANRDLKDAQEKQIQQEKMASLGLLMAGIAHEINNPAGFISSNLESLRKYIERFTEFITLQDGAIRDSGAGSTVAERVLVERKRLKIDRLLADAPQLIRESGEGAEKIRLIAQDMKCFSHNDDARMSMSDMNECLRSALRIAMNELKYKAEVTVEFGELPFISCFPQQLSQVFLNLLVNAGHAIETQGGITVRSWSEDGYIRVSISDTGCGIPEENIQRIFEPLFTTKVKGKGTGLGLSISTEIIQRHGGEITVSSCPGEGTAFTVSLPLQGGVEE